VETAGVELRERVNHEILQKLALIKPKMAARFADENVAQPLLIAPKIASKSASARGQFDP
jgi:hypothetical protein